MNRGEFTRAVFDKLHIPITGGRLEFGVAWGAYENTLAKNNLWATTMPSRDSTNFNDDGVKNYKTFEDGVNATVLTLLQTPYAHLLSTLRDLGSTMREIRGALNASPWGSKVSLALWREVVDRYDYYNVEVPGSGGDLPVPTPVKEGAKAVETPSSEVAADADNVVETPKEETMTEEEVPTGEVDTLESREAALAASEAEAAKTIPEVEEEVKAEAPADTAETATALKAKIVEIAEDFLAKLKEL